MRAVAFSSYGSADVLQVMPFNDPHPGPGQVRVRVKAAGVQPVDTAVRGGWSGNGFPVRFPQIVGNEFAGIVDQAGEGVEGFAVGSDVLGWSVLACYAEYVAVGSDQIALKPQSMPWEEAGALSASGQTAHTALEDLGVSAGDTVLVHAAAGGVGTMAVQLALAAGATVIGTASERNHDYLRSLGAIPVAYGAGLADRVRALAPGGVDAAFDAVGGEALRVSTELVADKSRIGTIVDFAGAEQLGVRAIRSRRSVQRLNALLDLYVQGKLRVCIWKSFPLEQAAAAHREVETGHVRGKVVLTVD
ncbi:NADP-dependent oxidoreductase [Paenibacillus allorhizosphaerae]|uniref:2-haloacrylate reductase n=1 Tax=Paenibacillus allorhizosphaerae TaxID=2849866 RepID=A0ABN7TEL8_9BACL|nr:NADP-dependent oxidoreductase [Paenibacillus allorhizosphaerae]CAG7627186.1 2-haloacrylate reductase [Paenibacillus allorhizosphaerae]